jgi:N6-adenosine-specific RNA methylase IME4
VLQNFAAPCDPPDAGYTRTVLAAEVGVSGPTFEALCDVNENGTEELKKAVRAGAIGASTAAKVSKLAPEKQDELSKADKRTITKALRDKRCEEHRAASELPDAKYRIVYADPPWSYGNSMPEECGVPTDHYPAMTLEEICALKVKNLSAANSALFLWATSPHLREAFDVIDAWGFEYKTSFVWDKVLHNMGHYNSVRHEFLLVCTRGSCTPDVHKLFDSVVTEERTEHSRKPEIFRSIIDTIYTFGKRIELFRRGAAPEGWDTWGDEA